MKAMIQLFNILYFYVIRLYLSNGLVVDFRNVQTVGMKLPSYYTFLNNSATSVYLCMDICYRFSFCKSVNYLASQKMCMLNTADSSKVNLVPDQDSRYIERVNMPTDVVKAECIGHSCPTEELCLKNNTCSQWLFVDCGEIEYDRRAIVEYTDTWAHATATCRCKRPYPPTQPPNETMKCMMSGAWSSPSLQCASTCLSPPDYRAEEVKTFGYLGTDVMAYYTCSSFPDPSPTPSCPVAHCNQNEGPEAWKLYYPPKLSCSAADCFNQNAHYYWGRVSCTVSGRTCMNWGSNNPHRPNFRPHISEHNTNYCRPLNTIAPWCYTTDPSVRWEFCHVPIC